MRWLLVGCMAIALTACGGGKTTPVAKLPQLVLQQDDLSPEFAQFDSGRQVRADQPAGERADEARFGRLGGWKARYRRSGSRATTGPLVVESRADAFKTSDGAKEELDAIAAEWKAAGTAANVGAPLGDAAVASSVGQGAGAFATRFLEVAWRYRNVVGFVSVTGFERKVALKDALRLAHEQQLRMAAAG
jgi:hypothetical protein